MFLTKPEGSWYHPHMSAHEQFMTMAILNARRALDAGEFPVGCIIMDGEQVVADGSRRNTSGRVAGEVHHAEINALRNLELWEREAGPLNRSAFTVYVTLEPCLMCFGAILISGINRIVYAMEDVLGGGTSCNLEALPPLYRDRPLSITPGVMREESLTLLREYFRNPENTYLKDSLLAAAILNA